MSSVTTPITHGFSLRLCALPLAATRAIMLEGDGPGVLRCSSTVSGPPPAPEGVGGCVWVRAGAGEHGHEAERSRVHFGLSEAASISDSLSGALIGREVGL